MLDKIRLHAAGELEPEYHANLGKGGDGRCTGFLRVRYEDLRARVLEGGTDEEILEWCFANGRRLDEGDAKIWTGFITKLGWKDAVTPHLEKAKTEAGFADRADIQCMPQLMDAEEGRGG
jgi:gluconokinase